MSTDREERARVKSRIGSLILEFCDFRLHGYGISFHMEDLHLFVQQRLPFNGRVAPASTDRILRQLRQQGLLNYKVVSRRQSLYRVVPVERPAEQAELFAMTKEEWGKG